LLHHGNVYAFVHVARAALLKPARPVKSISSEIANF
jgi:hypothetical protein